MKGVWNKVLRVDLSRGTCQAETIPDAIYEYFLGGEGLGAYLMWRESPRGTLPFDPANCLTFAAGTLNGIAQTGAGKWATTAISPSGLPKCRFRGHGEFWHRDEGHGI